jgi:hypothetical protein
MYQALGILPRQTRVGSCRVQTPVTTRIAVRPTAIFSPCGPTRAFSIGSSKPKTDPLWIFKEDKQCWGTFKRYVRGLASSV